MAQILPSRYTTSSLRVRNTSHTHTCSTNCFYFYKQLKCKWWQYNMQRLWICTYKFINLIICPKLDYDTVTQVSFFFSHYDEKLRHRLFTSCRWKERFPILRLSSFNILYLAILLQSCSLYWLSPWKFSVRNSIVWFIKLLTATTYFLRDGKVKDFIKLTPTLIDLHPNAVIYAVTRDVASSQCAPWQLCSTAHLIQIHSQ